MSDDKKPVRAAETPVSGGDDSPTRPRPGVLPLMEAAASWPARGCLLGLDLGTKTIGVAASDPDRRLALPVTTLPRTRFSADAAALAALCKERAAVGFVLGLPINMDSTEGPRAQASRAFGRNLAAALGLSVGLWDERLSTAAVERELIDNTNMSRARRKEVIDQQAAVFILQGALDRLGGSRGPAF